MATSLEKAFAKAANLPKPLQEQLAAQMLEDIVGEQKWDSTLARSQDLLEAMASKARLAKRQGKARKLGFDEL